MGKKSKALPGQSGGLYQPCRGWQLWGRQIPSNQQASADVKADSMKGSWLKFGVGIRSAMARFGKLKNCIGQAAEA